MSCQSRHERGKNRARQPDALNHLYQNELRASTARPDGADCLPLGLPVPLSDTSCLALRSPPGPSVRSHLPYVLTDRDDSKVGRLPSDGRKAVPKGISSDVVETAEDTPQRNAPSYRNMLSFGFREVYVRPNYIYDTQA